MPEVYSKALDESIEVDRIIGQVISEERGPCMIFTGGIHGNEPSGIFALQQVLTEIKEKNIPVKGSIHAISGNLWALQRGERFHEKDLNRLWIGPRMRQLENDKFDPVNEDEREQKEIYKVLQDVMESNKGPYYFMDLHTTSSQTIPFLTVNDSLLNRKFTKQYPVPIILGIEEYLDGPLLSYINKLGYVAFGYEGGQHDALSAIENHVSFIYLSLVFSGSIRKEDIDFDKYFTSLSAVCADTRSFYEIYYRHAVKDEDAFKMKPGYSNFQYLNAGEHFADSSSGSINSEGKTRIFMPLYQSKGSDGYFLIRKIPKWTLNLSAIFRKWRMDRLMVLLPGVKWAKFDKTAIYVNRRIARIFTKQIFHLLGYRSRELSEDQYYMRNREAASRKADYRNAPWNG
jgi:hypothetical protein